MTLLFIGHKNRVHTRVKYRRLKFEFATVALFYLKHVIPLVKFTACLLQNSNNAIVKMVDLPLALKTATLNRFSEVMYHWGEICY